jgi:hypothetical protein
MTPQNIFQGASFVGVQTVMGIQCNVFTDSFETPQGTVNVTISFSVDDGTPVSLTETLPGITILMIVTNFIPAIPAPTMFAIPSICSANVVPRSVNERATSFVFGF